MLKINIILNIFILEITVFSLVKTVGEYLDFYCIIIVINKLLQNAVDSSVSSSSLLLYFICSIHMRTVHC